MDDNLDRHVHYLVGDTLAYGDLAGLLELVLRRPFKTYAWSIPYLLDAIAEETDVQAKHIKKYRAVFAQDRGVSWLKDATFKARQDIAVTTIWSSGRWGRRVIRTCSRSAARRPNRVENAFGMLIDHS